MKDQLEAGTRLMNLRKAKGKMYKKVTHTGTFYQGCNHGCCYCWADRIPTVSHSPRYIGSDSKLRVRHAYVFVNSAHDTFADCIPDEWIGKMFTWISQQHPSISFLIQTKNTGRMVDYFRYLNTKYNWIMTGLRKKLVLATTMETNRTYTENLEGEKMYAGEVPSINERSKHMFELGTMGLKRMISVEPVMDFDLTLFANILLSINPIYIEIGPDNYNCALPEPSYVDVKTLIAILRDEGVEVIEKDGLERLK